MKSYIIGLAGNKNSGKDTVASMINYIFAVGITKATYSEWILKRVSYDETYKDRIIHFADSLKTCLSIIYNIPLEYFYNQVYKDEMYYCFNSGKFLDKNIVIQHPNDFNIITNDVLKHSSLKDEFETYDELRPVITIRTLMQYFGTDVCRENLGHDIWIKSALGKIVDVARRRRLCIVPDVRFTNESAAIHKRNAFLYGVSIRINRPTSNNNRDYHDSEIIAFSTDYSINNDGTLANLFYKTLEICQKILLERL